MKTLRSSVSDSPGADSSGRDEPLGAVILTMRDEMLLLHQRLDALLRDVRRRVIQFTAARREEGTSTIVRAYARALADDVQRSVLIVDGNEIHPDQHLHFGIDALVGWDDLIVRGEPMQRGVYITSHPSLSIVPFSRRSSSIPRLVDLATVEQVFAQLRSRFDVVLVDSGPVFQPGAVGTSRMSDGIVLVVEAERTRWPIALKAKESLERGGGTVLGIVLNKRRYHIPDAVYRWL
jgi:Mrp family chromosome partitioning ATPase